MKKRELANRLLAAEQMPVRDRVTVLRGLVDEMGLMGDGYDAAILCGLADALDATHYTLAQLQQRYAEAADLGESKRKGSKGASEGEEGSK